VLHELGHVLGYADIDPALEADDWMTATLGTGIRRLPDPLSAENMLTFDPSVHDRAFASRHLGPITSITTWVATRRVL